MSHRKNAMRKLSLSNHAQEEVSRLEEKRYDRYKTKIHAYHLDTHVYDYEIGRLKKKALEPWSTPVYPSFSFQKLSLVSNFSVKLGKSSFYGLLIAKKRIFDKPKKPKEEIDEKSKEQKIWEAGKAGEDIFDAYLSSFLDDRWVAISGYKNGKGEIDKILVGPNGVACCEVKYINGKISCDGDQWYSNKYDKYGNLVEEQKPIKDKKGRGPSKQVNEPSKLLELEISKKVKIKCYNFVILTHERSRLGELNDITVDGVFCYIGFNPENEMQTKVGKLSAEDVDSIVDMIIKDNKSNRDNLFSMKSKLG